MPLPTVLVSAFHAGGQGHLLQVDLNQGTYQALLPYQGSFCTTPEHLFVARQEGDRTRLEKYDRSGLVWMRRVPDCFDTHSLALLDGEIAVCATGTNEVIFLDAEGSVRRRWSPDERAEPDAWHLNSLVADGGRLYATCFGRFAHFRDWATRLHGAGQLLEIDTGRVVRDGLSAPHDPRRLPGGWLVNDSARSRTLWLPDAGPAETIATGAGFSRGLAVFPWGCVIGFSSPRTLPTEQGCAAIVAVERPSNRVLRTINLPYAEIGHIFPAPDGDVLDAVRREQAGAGHGLLPQRETIAETDRAGGIDALGPLQEWTAAPRPHMFQVPIRIRNRGQALWSSRNEVPLHIAYQVLDEHGTAVVPDGARTSLPLPLPPGQDVSFTLTVDLACCAYLPMAVALRVTLVQEGVAWWQATPAWSPAVVPVPKPSLTALAQRWTARVKRRLLSSARGERA